MALVTIPAAELKRLDKEIQEQGRIIKKQQKLLEDLMAAVEDTLNLWKPAPAPEGEIADIEQIIRSEK